jgi:outer membrane protein W
MRDGLILLIMGLTITWAAAARAQQCDDSDSCTNPDMCSDGMCVGTPQSGGSCDDGNPCTTDDTCVDGECMGTPQTGGGCDDANPCTSGDECFSGICVGPTPAAEDTPCADGCGQCKPQFPFPGSPLTCQARPDAQGQTCGTNVQPCLESRCMVTPVLGVEFVSCATQPKQCPDTDGNKCTDNCNFKTGQCEVDSPPPCFPGCEECNPSVGCEPANLGAACDDFDVCTPQSRCEAVTFPGLGTRGVCRAGEPTITLPTATASSTPTATPTPTNTMPAATATATPSATPTSTPSVTRTRTPTVSPTASNTPTRTPTANGTATPTGTPTHTFTRTATPTATATDTPTRTPTGGTPQVETPTPTATPKCPGDCNGDGKVSIDELILAVEAALGVRPLEDCSSLDTDRSGTLEIDELVAAVEAALNGC